MNIPLRTTKQEIPAVCPMLRTKNAYTNFGDDTDVAPWQLAQSTTAVYWCLKTMQHAGPDEGLAHPHHCLAGRTCFQPPAE
jgi:hypothetical protein